MGESASERTGDDEPSMGFVAQMTEFVREALARQRLVQLTWSPVPGLGPKP